MNSTDPKRLSSLENVPELTDALAAARERLPASNTLEALRTRLEAAVDAPIDAPIDAPVAAPFKSWPVALKIVVPLLGVAAAVIAAPRFARDAAAPLPSVATPVSSISAPVRSEPPLSEPAPNSTLPLPPPAASAATRGSARPAILSATPPAVGGAAAPAVVASAAVVTEPLPTPPAHVASELEIVKEAGQVLKSDPARALQLTMDHARLFPSGALAEEREVIAIEALARLGKRSAARSRAERFLVGYPRSAHLSRVQLASGLDTNTDAGDQN